MRTSFFGLNTLLSSLRAQQEALDTTNHNIANANTDGYSRQEVNLAATTPYTLPSSNRDSGLALQIGTGVMVNQIQRMRDQFNDVELRAQSQVQSQADALASGLGQVQSIIGQIGDTSLQNLLSKFFNAWGDLANNPQSDAVRATVQQAGQGIVNWFNNTGNQLEQLRKDTDSAIALKTNDINDMASQIASLNGVIKRSLTVGDQPNDLLDRRDQLIDKLAQLTGATTRQELDGTTTVYLGGRALVQGDESHAVTTEVVTLPNGKQIHQVEWSQDSQPVSVDGGELSALLNLRDNVIPSKISQIDTLAQTLVQQVNAQQTQGTGKGAYAGPPAAPPVNFFNAAGLTASTMDLDPTIKVDTQAIAAAGNPSSGDGDNTNALAMAALMQQTFASLGGMTFNDYQASNIAALGAETSQAQQTSDNQKALVDHLTQRRQALSGVSLDEEATSLIKYQRAYQAAARGITVMDDLLDAVINHMGRAGL